MLLKLCLQNVGHFVSSLKWRYNIALYINGLVQDCSISIANALEILQSCTKPSIDYVNLYFNGSVQGRGLW